MNGITSTTSGNVGNKKLVDLMTAIGLGYQRTNTSENGKIGSVEDKFGQSLYTPDKTEGYSILSPTAKYGTNYHVAGFTISITDAQGNVKKAANAALNDFKLYQRAENYTGDKSLTFHVGSEANVAIKVGLTDMRLMLWGLKAPTAPESASRQRKMPTPPLTFSTTR